MGTVKVTNIEPIADNGTVTLGSSGDTITVTNGIMSGHMYPAFEAYLSADQSVSDGTDTKVQIDSKVYDIGGYYDNTTNYRYTPLVAGKYFVYGQVMLMAGSSSDFNLGVTYVYKNGSSLLTGQLDHRFNSAGYVSSVIAQGVVDMNGSTDYLELFGYIDGNTAGSEEFFGHATLRYTAFGAYRIGS